MSKNLNSITDKTHTILRNVEVGDSQCHEVLPPCCTGPVGVFPGPGKKGSLGYSHHTQPYVSQTPLPRREAGGGKKKQIKRKNDMKSGNIRRKGILEMSKDVGVELNRISINNYFCSAYIFSPDYILNFAKLYLFHYKPNL